MGYSIERFMIVHDHSKETVEHARNLATCIFAASLISPCMSGIINDCHGFIIWTSGSQNGWSTADEHRTNIETLIRKMSALPEPPRWCLASDGEALGDLQIEHGYDGNYTHIYERVSVGRRPDSDQ